MEDKIKKIEKAAVAYGKRTQNPIDSACGFIEGVHWCLRDLWHQMSEEPPCGTELLLRTDKPLNTPGSGTCAVYHYEFGSTTAGNCFEKTIGFLDGLMYRT